jgi:hypothetical protein
VAQISGERSPAHRQQRDGEAPSKREVRKSAKLGSNPAMAEQPAEDLIASYGLVRRDQSVLFQMPFEFRWEYTRRHPYYLSVWQVARAFRRHELTDSEHIKDGYVATELLGLIGVTGEPQNPALAFQELDDFDLGFLSGAVQPMTNRAVLVAMLNALPDAELQVISAVLNTASNEEYSIPGDADGSLRRRSAIRHLTQIASPALDSYLDLPLFYIHLESSQRRIVDDLEALVTRWKKRRGIGEQRVHVGKLPEYLRIWDQREGWDGGIYHRHKERTFVQIAEDLGQPKSTIVNGYQGAFERITGHEFNCELWLRLMLGVKAHDFDYAQHPTISARYRRLMNDARPKPVPESQLQPRDLDKHRIGIVEQNSLVGGDQDLAELELNIKMLIDRGRTDEEIAQELDMHHPEIIAYLRGRLGDFA